VRPNRNGMIASVSKNSAKADALTSIWGLSFFDRLPLPLPVWHHENGSFKVLKTQRSNSLNSRWTSAQKSGFGYELSSRDLSALGTYMRLCVTE